VCVGVMISACITFGISVLNSFLEHEKALLFWMVILEMTDVVACGDVIIKKWRKS